MNAKQVAVGLACAVFVCSTASPEPSPTPSASAEANAPPKPKPSPTPSEPDYCEFSISCFSNDYSTKTPFDSIEEAWTATGIGVFASCEARRLRGSEHSPEQEAALDGALYGDESLNLLVAMCADLGHTYDQMAAISTNQVTDVTGIAALCPNRPGLNGLLAKAGVAGQAEAEGAAGTRFSSGVLLVGSQVQPGACAHDGRVEGCYWERTDSAGNIINKLLHERRCSRRGDYSGGRLLLQLHRLRRVVEDRMTLPF